MEHLAGILTVAEVFAGMEKVYQVEVKRPIDGGNPISMIVGVRLRNEEAGSEEEEGSAFRPLADEECKV